MLSSKQRAYLRKFANKENAIFQIGKAGLTDEIISEIDYVLEKRELIKITVLETSMLTARQACDAICEKTGAEGVFCIGNKAVIFRKAKKDTKFILPGEKK